MQYKQVVEIKAGKIPGKIVDMAQKHSVSTRSILVTCLASLLQEELRTERADLLKPFSSFTLIDYLNWVFCCSFCS